MNLRFISLKRRTVCTSGSSSYSSRVLKCQKLAILILGLLLAMARNQRMGCRHFASAFRAPAVFVNTLSKHASFVSDNQGVAALVRTSSTDATGTQLKAKNTNKNKKRSGGPRGGGRRGKSKRDGMPDEEDDKDKKKSIREPSKLRKRIIELDRSNSKNKENQLLLPPLRVCSVEVDDREWWEHEDNENPYGARLWPSALAISEFLVSGMDGFEATLEQYEILEVGCGAGLVSIVAAECGANVVASDVSPTVLKLCRTGWKETQKFRQKEDLARQMKLEKKLRLQKLRERAAAAAGTDKELPPPPSFLKNLEEEESSVRNPGTLTTLNLDLFTEDPLPVLSSNSTTPQMLIATAMMYEADLATVLAQRAMEACQSGAWVVIGDDDTGEREGGRNLFVSEMDRMEKEQGVSFARTWTTSKVRSKALSWNEKAVRVLHLNAPPDVEESLQRES